MPALGQSGWFKKGIFFQRAWGKDWGQKKGKKEHFFGSFLAAEKKLGRKKIALPQPQTTERPNCQMSA
jgi:hypothetical protein